MTNIFKTVEAEAFRAGITPRTKQSQAWFRKKVQNMNVNRRGLMSEEPIEKSPYERGDIKMRLLL